MDATQETALFAGLTVQFLVFLVLGIFLAIGNYALARRLGKNRIAWVILSLIPVVNFVFLYYVFYQVIFGILDRLPAEKRADA